jgi:hypothetical protein
MPCLVRSRQNETLLSPPVLLSVDVAPEASFTSGTEPARC